MTDDGAPQAQQHLNIMHLPVYMCVCVRVCAIIDCLLATSTLVGFSFLIIYRRGHSQLIFRTTAHFVIALQIKRARRGKGGARVEGVDRVGWTPEGVCRDKLCSAEAIFEYEKPFQLLQKLPISNSIFILLLFLCRIIVAWTLISAWAPRWWR